MRIRWSRVLLVVLAIIAIAHWDAIREAVAALDLGGLWAGFAETLRDLPPGGQYLVVLATSALVFIAIYRLVVMVCRQDRRPPPPKPESEHPRRDDDDDTVRLP